MHIFFLFFTFCNFSCAKHKKECTFTTSSNDTLDNDNTEPQIHQVELCLNKTKDFWLDLLNTEDGYDIKVYRHEFDKGDVTQWDLVDIDHTYYGKSVKDYEEFDGDSVCLMPRFEEDYNQAIVIIDALSFIYTTFEMMPEHFANDLKSFFMDDLKSYERDADHMIEIFEAHVREWEERHTEAGF